MDTIIEPAAIAEAPWEAVVDGEYAIVELFGHTTLVGRIAEAERFGAKMLAIQPLFNGRLLDAIFHGGAAIYRLTPCTREVAWKKQPTDTWNLPPAVRAIVPPEALPSPKGETATADDAETDDDQEEFGF
jgi:hypothetical protein